MQPVLNLRADRSTVRRVPAPNVLLGNSVGQGQDEHGALPDRFPPERAATFSAHLLHTGRARTSQKSKLNGPGCLMPDQPTDKHVTSAFELSRWRDGRCCMGFPRALLSV